MADQIALLEHGRLIAHAPPRTLYERPPSRRAARQMGIDAFLCGTVSGTTLHTDHGAFTFTCAEPQPGPATLAIRPEHLRLIEHPAPNAVAAVVRQQIFRGEQSEYLVNMGDAPLRVRVAGTCAYPPGTPMYVLFPPEHLFPVIDDASYE
jgi:ABC-type Fe3+/spermidine/putrescine transport system ATPase subunit